MLNDQEKQRFSRNLALPEWDEHAQQALFDAKVLVIGAGGLGAPVLYYLAASGVGTIAVVDADRVDVSNLQRQILFDEAAIGHKKVVVAKERLQALHAKTQVLPHDMRFTEENATELVSAYDIVVDCSDNFATRFLLHDRCYRQRKTLVWAAVSGFTAQVTTFKAYLGGDHPCYHCFCPAIPPQEAQASCSHGGVLGSVVGMAGSLQATETIKELLNLGDSLSGTIVRYDGLRNSFKHSVLHRNRQCVLCA